MANSLGQAWRSFWHTMTSNDRHASHDSPYRTGQHVPLNQSRHAPLTSVATSAIESTPNLGQPDEDEMPKRPTISTDVFSSSGMTPSSARPYSPGMRSMSSPKVPTVEEMPSPGEIQMQSFADGAPPPPPVSHSWKKIDEWAEKKYEELYDQLGGGCTQNDINELEHELNCSLPQDVRESLAIHDGQERGGNPTGIIFGCMLLDCEEIVQEWKNWKTVNEEYLSGRKKHQPQYPLKALNNASSSAHQAQHASNKLWRQELIERQDSQPPQAIQKAYAHPSWIPLARDWGGNNIAVDLAPGPAGKWGQVVIFGRDYDCKYVIARSWAVFLSVVADDISSEKVFVDEETGELKLKEFRAESVEPAYLDILRWRADQKHGRKSRKKPPTGPLGLNTNISSRTGRDSPYHSPVGSNEDRGRSPQRFTRGPNASPRFQVGSPLARQLHAEMPAPVPIRPGSDIVKDFAAHSLVTRTAKPEKLVDAPTPTTERGDAKPDLPLLTKLGKQKLIDVPTPISAHEDRRIDLPRPATIDEDKENHTDAAVTGLGVGGLGEMKSVQI